MSESNFYSVITIMGAILLLPVALYMEPASSIVQGLRTAHAVGGRTFWLNLLGSGVCFLLYNELAFTVLGRVDPAGLVMSAAC